MDQLGKVASGAVAQLRDKASRVSHLPAPALPAGTAEAPTYFDRYCDIEVPKLFSAWRPDNGPREIVRALMPDERMAVQRRAETLRLGLMRYTETERNMVEAELAAMFSGFRSMRQQGSDAEGTVAVTATVLAVFPLWAIAKGCLKIARRDAGLDPRFAPNDTEIFGVVDAIVREYRATLETVEALLAAPVEPPRALPAPRPSAADVEAGLGRPVSPAVSKPVRENDAVRPPDGRHAERVAAELAARRAQRSAPASGAMEERQ